MKVKTRELRYYSGKTINSLYCIFTHRFIIWEINPWPIVDGENLLNCGYYHNGHNLHFMCLYVIYTDFLLPKITEKKIFLGKVLCFICVFSLCTLLVQSEYGKDRYTHIHTKQIGRPDMCKVPLWVQVDIHAYSIIFSTPL